MNKQRLLYILLTLISLCGTAACIVMTVMAACFGELGRVLFYGILSLLLIELLIFAVIRVVKNFRR